MKFKKTQIPTAMPAKDKDGERFVRMDTVFDVLVADEEARR